jgi:hypothetical protein
MFNFGWNQKNIDLIKNKLKNIGFIYKITDFIDFLDEKYKSELINIFKWTNYLEILNTISYLYGKYINKFEDFQYLKKDGIYYYKLKKGEKYEKIINDTKLINLAIEYNEILNEKRKKIYAEEKEKEKLFLEKCIEEEKNDSTLLDRIKADLPEIPKLFFDGNEYIRRKLMEIIIDYYDNIFEELFNKYNLLKLLTYELKEDGNFEVDIYTIGRYELEFKKKYYGKENENEYKNLNSNKKIIYKYTYSKLYRPYPTGDGQS